MKGAKSLSQLKSLPPTTPLLFENLFLTPHSWFDFTSVTDFLLLLIIILSFTESPRQLGRGSSSFHMHLYFISTSTRLLKSGSSQSIVNMYNERAKGRGGKELLDTDNQSTVARMLTDAFLCLACGLTRAPFVSRTRRIRCSETCSYTERSRVSGGRRYTETAVE